MKNKLFKSFALIAILSIIPTQTMDIYSKPTVTEKSLIRGIGHIATVCALEGILFGALIGSTIGFVRPKGSAGKGALYGAGIGSVTMGTIGVLLGTGGLIASSVLLLKLQKR